MKETKKQMSEGLKRRLKETRIKNKKRLEELKERENTFGLTVDEYEELHILKDVLRGR